MTIESNGEFGVVLNSASDGAGLNANLNFKRSRGLITAPTAIQDDDGIMDITTSSYANGAWNWNGLLSFQVDGSDYTNGVPTKFGISTQAVDGTLNSRFVIRADGNIGIGKSNPAAKLHISNGNLGSGTGYDEMILEGNGEVGMLIKTADNNPSRNPEIYTFRSRGTLLAPAKVEQNDDLFSLWSMGYDGTIGRLVTGIENQVDTPTGVDNIRGRITFRTNSGGEVFPSERMRITSTGRVGIGTTAPGYTLDVVGDINATGCVRDSGTCLSDIRIKKDIEPFELGLEALLEISPKRYRFNGLGEHPISNGEKSLGVIAQEIEKIAPELISTRDVKLHPEDRQTSKLKQVNYTAFIYIVINAVKEFYNRWESDSTSLHQEILVLKNDILEKDQKLKDLEKETKLLHSYLCQKDPDIAFCAKQR